MNIIAELLKEKAARAAYEIRVIAALKIHYNFVDKETVSARESVTAGHVYSYLSAILNETNSWKFQRKIKALLIENDIIKPVPHGGMLWFKGIAGLEEDTLIANTVIAQHYKDRENYRNKQREHANKRYIIIQLHNSNNS